jgi:hypothetical protein
MTTLKYIIANNYPVAFVRTETKGSVRYGFKAVREEIDANRELNLVNAKSGKISEAKKWAFWERTHPDLPFAKEINPGHFLIS